MAIDRVIRRSRRVALLFGGLGAGSIAALQLAPSGSFSSFFLAAYNLGLVLSGVYAALFWSTHRRRPAGLEIGRRRGQPAFPVPDTPILRGMMIVLMGPSMAILAATPFYDEVFDGITLVLARSVMVAFAAFCVGFHVWALYRMSSVRLTPEGLVVPVRRRIPWDALAPDGPSARSVQGATLWLLVRHATPGGRPYTGPTTAHPLPPYEWYPLNLRYLYVDANFLAAAIRHYRGNPAARASIGTQKGYQQLLDALTEPASTTTAAHPSTAGHAMTPTDGLAVGGQSR